MRQPGIESDGTIFPARHRRGQHPRLQQIWHPQINNQSVARGGTDRPQLVHDSAHHSVASDGQNSFADRAFRDDAHVAKGVCQCRLYLFYSRDFSDADLWAFCLWLGLSHSRFAGFLRLATKENRSSSETISVPAVSVRPAHRCAVHVCLAHCLSVVLEPAAHAHHSEIY